MSCSCFGDNSWFVVTIVRHAQSEGNRLRLLQGQSDQHQLSTLGLQQAAAVGERLASTNFTHVFCSDLQRARQTCQIISDHNISISDKSIQKAREIIENQLLRERNFGDLEDRPVSELMSAAKAAGQSVGSFVPAGGAESLSQVRHRAVHFLRQLCDRFQHERKQQQQERNEGESSRQRWHVLVVSHGCWIRELLRHVLVASGGAAMVAGLDAATAGMLPPNTAVTRLIIWPRSQPEQRATQATTVDGDIERFVCELVHCRSHLSDVTSTLLSHV